MASTSIVIAIFSTSGCAAFPNADAVRVESDDCHRVAAEAEKIEREQGDRAAAGYLHRSVLSADASSLTAQCRLDLVGLLGESCERLDSGALYSCAALLEEAATAANLSPYDRWAIQDDVLDRTFKQYEKEGNAQGAEQTLKDRHRINAGCPKSGTEDCLSELLLKEGDFYFDQHQLEDAEKAYTELLAISRQTKELGDMDSVFPLSRLARVREAQGNFAQARMYLEQVIAIVESQDGNDSLALVLPLEQYARVLTALGEVALADDATRRAASLRHHSK
jgi:tetratricopeptide (TPR) repeat protein